MVTEIKTQQIPQFISRKTRLERYRITIKQRYPNGKPQSISQQKKYNIFCIRTALRSCGSLDRDLLEKITKIPRSTIFDTIKQYRVRKRKLYLPKGRPIIIYYAYKKRNEND